MTVDALDSLLHNAKLGDLAARDVFYDLAFNRLRSIASKLLRHERPGHTLQPTALVNEFFLKLRRFESDILNQDHFFRLAARAMRQVLIDHSRMSRRAVSVSPQEAAELLGLFHANASLESGIAVREVFEKLRAMDEQVASTVWLRSVDGLTANEISRMQNRELWRVRADCDFGLHWMAGRLKSQA